MSIRQIAAITGQDRKAIRDDLRAPLVTRGKLKRRRRTSKLDPFKELLADRLRARIWRPSLLLRDLKAQGYRGGITILADYIRQQQPAAQSDTFPWMLAVLQGAISHDGIASQLPDVAELERLLTYVREGRRSVRNRALSVLARSRGIPMADVGAFLHIGQKTLIRYSQLYRNGGLELLMAKSVRGTKKCDQQLVRDAVFSVLHTPPSEHGINRTDWRMADIQAVLKKVGEPLSPDIIREIIRSAGYKWRKARVVLTSNDPRYKEKVEKIKTILSELGANEAFFSIDEFGPFAIKKKGGRKRVAPGERFTVPQWQRSKGWMIITAALELSSNQISHFYSMKKNTDEMIRMADLLRAEYRSRSKIYLSWDAASWHISKKLFDHLDGINEHAAADGYPTIETAPLPAGAQFLNVIESVFSGMARAVIHKSNYASVDLAKSAIDLYFKERNFRYWYSLILIVCVYWGCANTTMTIVSSVCGGSRFSVAGPPGTSGVNTRTVPSLGVPISSSLIGPWTSSGMPRKELARVFAASIVPGEAFGLMWTVIPGGFCSADTVGACGKFQCASCSTLMSSRCFVTIPVHPSRLVRSRNSV